MRLTLAALASIPSPGSDHIGPFRFYGMLIALGALAAVLLASRRMRPRGFHPDVASELSIPALVGGIIGARMYHVVTDNAWGRFWAIWEGGLGIPGGIVGGTLSVFIWARIKGYPVTPLFDILAPTLPLAQAIGRWGNWFNQELYGKPTTLPWGLEIDGQTETFHPTFLYESLWNIGLVIFMLWLDKKRVLRPGRLFLVYTSGYALGRLWVEAIRIDTATLIGGVRINIWVMGFVLAASLIGLATSGRRAEGENDDGSIDPVPVAAKA